MTSLIARRLAPQEVWPGLLLALLALVIYTPALNRVFVADQISYFAELGGSTSLVDGLRHYDYAASRRYWKGDDALFRPLEFVWLAVGNRALSYHHVWWNVATLVLHFLVAVFLLRLLRTIQPSGFALPVSVLFLVMKPPLELVVWNHLGGYLLGGLFLMIALRAFTRMTVDAETPTPPGILASYALGFTAAAFCHEAIFLASFLAAVLIIFLDWWRGKRMSTGKLFAVAVPIVAFGLFYAFHIARVERLSYVDRSDARGIFNLANAIMVVPGTLRVLARWAAEVGMPSALTLTSSAFYRLSKVFAPSWSEIQLWNALLCVATIRLIAGSLSKRQLSRMAPLLVLLSGALFAYAAVINFGRAEGEVASIAYYLYLFCVLFVPFVYAAVDFDRIRAWMVPAAWIIIGLLIILNGVQARAVVADIGRANENASAYFNAIAHFVDEHKTEGGFSFAIQAPPLDLDPEVPLKEGYPDDPRPVIGVRLSRILFARYYNEHSPRYIIDRNGRVLATR